MDETRTSQPKIETEQSDEAIVTKIVSNATLISERKKQRELAESYRRISGSDNYANWETAPDITDEQKPIWRIYYGGKVLFISFVELTKQVGLFGTHIIRDTNIPTTEPNETTILYKAAKKLMIKYKNKTSKKDCLYDMYTRNPKMALWVLNTAGQIFPNSKINTRIKKGASLEECPVDECLLFLEKNFKNITDGDIAVSLKTNL